MGIIFTRPSYQGILNKKETFQDLVRICHNHQASVIVDEAHGGHLRFLGKGSIISGKRKLFLYCIIMC
jgi:bifunctional pyridoxal-dependent enzyme with beta-cystathionase and maltose regulon repressor activities